MGGKKLTANRIFDGYSFHDDTVLVLAEDGSVESLVPRHEAGDDIEHLHGILVPGLVNCHCHLELSHMKGAIPEGTGLVDFVFKVVTERHHTEDEILAAIRKAEDAMLENGIVAVGDICNNALTVIQKQERRLAYYNFIEASGWLPSVASDRFNRAAAVYKQYEDVARLTRNAFETEPVNRNFFHNSIVPHAAYSVSNELWSFIQPFFKNKVVSIHNQETKFEDEFFQEGTGDFERMYKLMKIDNSHHKATGKTSLQSYFDKLSGAASIILVHNTFTKEADIDDLNAALSSRSTPDSQAPNFCLCVNANQYIERALPPVELLRKKSCHIVLGTDSLASNWTLSVADEMKTINKHFPQIPLEEILRWGTINGARALQMDSQVGSFEKGKTPGVVLMDENFGVTRVH